MKLSTLRIAWRNLGRNRKRTGLALAAIGIGQLGFLFMCGQYHGMSDAVLEIVTGPMTGHVQVHAPEWREERAVDLVLEDLDRTLAEIRSTDGVARASGRVYSPVLAALGETGFQAMVFGVEPDLEADRRGILTGVTEEARPGDASVLVGYLLARKLGVSGGEEIALVGLGADGSMANDLFKVNVVIRTHMDPINRLGIVMSLADAQDLFVMPDQAHEIIVHASEEGTSKKLADGLASLDSTRHAEVMSWKEVAPQLAGYINVIDKAGAFVLVLVLIASAVGVANTMMMSTFERQHEFGMLLSLGCRPRKVVWMIIVESVVLGITGVAVGTAFGASILTYFGHTGMDLGLSTESGTGVTIYAIEFPSFIYPQFRFGDALNGAIAVSVTAVLASLWPASYAARLEPSEAMRA